MSDEQGWRWRLRFPLGTRRRVTISVKVSPTTLLVRLVRAFLKVVAALSLICALWLVWDLVDELVREPWWNVWPQAITLYGFHGMFRAALYALQDTSDLEGLRS